MPGGHWLSASLSFLKTSTCLLGLDAAIMQASNSNAPVPTRTIMSLCRFCNSPSYGSGCLHSPHGKHEHNGDEGHCDFCNSPSYGSGCLHSPTRKHRHGHGARCIWCGSPSSGSGCLHSTTGKHER
ncbi:MAG: hypothetical protein EBS01_03720 [Verrucomicrobia bacterium]|nr:hypothetical protein [Verrucomicrobiota bacterium]